MDNSRVFLGEAELWEQATRQADRCARTMAVAGVFYSRALCVHRRAFRMTAARGLLAWIGAALRTRGLDRADKRRERGYAKRLRALPPGQLSDAGLARFIFGHCDLGMGVIEELTATLPAMPVELELWQALERLIGECERQQLAPALALTRARFVRDQFRPLMVGRAQA